MTPIALQIRTSSPPLWMGWLLLCTALTGACDKPSNRASATPSHNVLLITLDSTRADRLGCYGDEEAQTPFLDALAMEGVRFENAVATAGIATISLASILTGRNNHAHGLRVLGGQLEHRLPSTSPSLPQILGNRGWRTAGFASSYLAGPAFGLNQGFQQFSTGHAPASQPPAVTEEDRSAPLRRDAPINATQRRSDATTDEALTWLEEHGELGPWHLWLHYADLFDLALVPPRDYAMARGIDYEEDLLPEDLVARDRYYDLELGYLDQELGRLFDYLRNTGQYNNTIIVVVGGHGQGLSDGFLNHGWSGHRLLYNWSVKVPLILKLPDSPPGVVVADLVRTTDVLPTILEHVELLAPAGLDGRSLLPILRGEMDEPRLALADALNLEEAHGPNRPLPAHQLDNLYMVMDHRWKLIHHERHPERSELFDLLSDPQELSNVYAADSEVVARLLRVLRDHGALERQPKGRGGPAPDADALDQLGYGDRGR